MKGSTMFWLALLIAAILFGEYQLFIHMDTCRIKKNNTGIPVFYAVNIIALVFWEFIFGIDRSYDEYNFKEKG